MAKKKSFLESKGWKNFMKYLYGIGAAIVIAGALFKIMHWPGAATMLIVGMGTEVLIFFVSAFEPLHEDLDWTRVYPQLADEEQDFIDSIAEEDATGMSMEEGLVNVQKGLDQIHIPDDLFDSLSGSLSGLSQSVSKLSTVGDASLATNEYAENIKTASSKVAALNDNYNSAVTAMDSLASSVGNAAQGAAAYQEQVQAVTKNLTQLNQVYELEMQDAQKHISALNKFHGSIANAMGNMTEAAKGAEEYKSNVSSLNKNLSKLNSVYGGMLSAMGGSKA